MSTHSHRAFELKSRTSIRFFDEGAFSYVAFDFRSQCQMTLPMHRHVDSAYNEPRQERRKQAKIECGIH
jgi:hypothetical protein